MRGWMKSMMLVSAAALMAPASARGAAAPLPTQSFRDEHKEVKVHLGHVTKWVGELQGAKPEQQKQLASKVVGFFDEHIRPHAEWEEKHLYPVIDKLAGAEKNRFTSTMRYEHTVVARWIDELAAEAKKPAPDYVAFARRADNLLGLLWAHFEEEEEVLLPYADKKMTRAEFEKSVGKGAH